MKYVEVMVIFFSILKFCFGQGSSFDEFNTSRYTRVIGLGNAFTGLADDIETVYYNSAGLANLDYYSISYSNGQGTTLIIDDYLADNFAILIPTFEKVGKFALSVDRLNYESFSFKRSLYRLHYAKNILNKLSIGTSVNYYHLSVNSYVGVGQELGSDGQFTGNAFDVSISALYSIPIISIPGRNNELRIGLQMQNLFDTKIDYSNELNSDPKHQTFRTGISTIVTPNFSTIFSLIPLKIIVVADAVFYGTKYDFVLWQPNFGIEICLFEIINLRYGRENEEEIKNYYEYSPQHPVKRYGLGFEFPIHRLISSYERLLFSLDYSYSDWDKIDESKPFGFSKKPIRESYSIKFSVQF